MPTHKRCLVVNIHSYTGKAYDFGRYNCWHHVQSVRRDAGIDTPDFDATSPLYCNDAFESGHADSKGMIQVSEPRDFDAVLMLVRCGKRLDWHSGVYFDGLVSHCDMRARQVRIDSLSDLAQQCERVEFWR